MMRFVKAELGLGVEQRAKILNALADPTRLQMVDLLRERGEMSGTDLSEQLGISLAMHCHHSKILAEAGVVQKRKEGQTSYCSLNRALLGECLRMLL